MDGDDGNGAEREEAERDAILRRLLKTPPQPRDAGKSDKSKQSQRGDDEECAGRD